MADRDFVQVARAVIDHRHGALLALAIHDRDPVAAQEFLDQHRDLPRHTMAECPLRTLTGGR